VIASGANVPFADNEIFFGPTMEFADNACSVIPDFIANCGMARVFRYLMTDGTPITDEAIFNDVSACIGGALEAVYHRNAGKTGLSQTAMEIALEKLL
jgi:glutamate dehydrogenase/leucine dehydrogenase